MFVIRVMSMEEEKVKKILEDMGYKILCPKKIKIEKRNGIEHEIEKIIFTGYLFVDLISVTDKDYYKIKDTLNVISFLDSKYSLPNDEEEFIRVLDNDGKAIEKINVSFDEKRKAVVYMNDKYINTKNVIRVNARDKTITFRFNIAESIKNVTFNYREI